MHKLTQAKPSAALPKILLQLRQSITASATSTHQPSSVITETLDSMPETQRQILLLHALDEAIAAIELAANMADAMNTQHYGVSNLPSPEQALDAAASGKDGNQVNTTEEDPLFAAYRAFTESQPMYQDLYHYRNALARRLRTTDDTEAIEA